MGGVWPATLQKLSLGDAFNKPIVDVLWPASLEAAVVRVYLVSTSPPPASLRARPFLLFQEVLLLLNMKTFGTPLNFKPALEDEQDVGAAETYT